MAAVSADEILRLNRLVNYYDPPKDLHDAPGVNITKHGKVIQTAMTEMFGGPTPEGWVAVGKKIHFIKEQLQKNGVYNTILTTPEIIIRKKHSSGHNPAPEGLCFAQENGPTDVVSNARIIITPGSIPDPAGKTKKDSRNGLYSVTSLVDAHNSLPKEFLDNIGMDFISDLIELNKDGVNYKITINTNFGIITETFKGDTFAPMGGSDVEPSFFAGNPKKNAKIGVLIDEYTKAGTTPAKKTDILNKVKSYLLCKELGDTLQVVWLNHIFSKTRKTSDGTAVLKSNTVVGTTDEVVMFRSLINGVGVIRTVDVDGKAYMYMPRNLSADEMLKIRKEKIRIKQADVVGQNLSVIALLEGMITSARGDKYWVETSDWSKKDKAGKTFRAHGNEVLESLVAKLKTINQVTNDEFDELLLTASEDDVKTASTLAVRDRFKSPFVNYRNQYYKIISSVKKIGSVDFDVSRFTTTSIETFTRVAPGGGMRGGAKIKTEIENKVTNRFQSSVDYEIPQNMKFILDKNVSEKIGVGAINKYFLFCFIREFLPELFTYAKFMKAACNSVGLPAAVADEDYNYMDKLKLNIEYRWMENDLIDVGTYYENDKKNIYIKSPDISADDVFKLTKSILKYSDLFIKLFPDFNTNTIKYFFTNIKNNVFYHSPAEAFFDLDAAAVADDDAAAAAAAVADAAEEDAPMYGGSNEKEYDEAAGKAIAAYETHYADEIKDAYNHKERSYTRSILNAPMKSNTPRPTWSSASRSRVTPRPRHSPRGKNRPEYNVKQQLIFTGGRRHKKTRRAKKSKKRQTRRRR